jgi:gliding motility-associated-like protein
MVYLDKNCQFVVPDYVTINQLIDNCDTSNVTTRQTPAVGPVLTTLGNQNIRILVTDKSGNIDSCNFTIAVIDQDAPKVFCPENQEVTTNYSCVYKIEDYSALVRKDLDNCDANNVRITQFPIAGTLVSGTPINNSDNSAQTSVTMFIEDQSGNKDSCNFIVDVTCLSAIVISEFISPNGDGANDYLFIEGLERYPKNALVIYNRWGDVVYASTPYANNWKGQSSIGFYGNAVAGGAYFYSFQIEPGARPLTGYIIVKR